MATGYIDLPITGGTGVTSLDGLTGALTLVAGTGISIVDGSSTITISSTATALTIGTIDSQTKAANGAVIASNVLYMQTADATHVGLVSTGTQSFLGLKTMLNHFTVKNGSTAIWSSSTSTLNDEDGNPSIALKDRWLRNSGGAVILDYSGGLANFLRGARMGNASSNSVVDLFASSTNGGNYALYWPVAQGAVSTYLCNDGSGVLSWQPCTRTGRAVLVGGTVTVSLATVSTTSRIVVTSNVDGGTPGWLRVNNIVNATSFDIVSSSGTDTSTVSYHIVEA